MNGKIVSVSIPEYTIDEKPDFTLVGAKLDTAISENFEGVYLARALSLIDHPRYTLDQFAEVISRLGTDKYDPNRKGVGHEDFEPYRADLQAGRIEIRNGKLLSESFGEDVRRFYENTLLDRGYRLRIDIITLYDPEQMEQARKIDDSKPGTAPHLEQYLWRFKNPDRKSEALAGMIKVLK